MDPLEDRMRRTLRDDSWRLPVDPETLDRVHEGARRRRRRRTAVNVAAALAIVVGGSGVAFGVMVDRSGSDNMAGPSEDGETVATTGQKGGASGSPRTGRPKLPPSVNKSTPGASLKIGPAQADAVPKGFKPASMSGATSSTFWVLGSASSQPGKALIAKSNNKGRTFALRGGFKASVAPPDKPHPKAVTDVRFVDGSNGWAYGTDLWATHDDGKSWKRIDELDGRVVHLEAGRGRAYAIVEKTGGAELWTAESEQDDWERLDVELRDPSALAAVGSTVAVTDKTDTEAYTVISADFGQSFDRLRNTCDPTVEQSALSATKDSLWLKCTTGTSAALYRSLDDGRSWTPVPSQGEALPNSFVFGARNDKAAVAAVNDLTIGMGQGSGEAPVRGLGAPSYVGFTNQDVGYLLGSGGLFRTDNGGRAWSEIAVE